MALILLETFGIDTGGPSLESGKVFLDTEGNGGQGSIVYQGPAFGGGQFDIVNRTQYPDLEYPQSPMFLPSGYRVSLFQDLEDPPFGTIQSEPVVCDIMIQSIDVVNPTAPNNGQITVIATGTNGLRRYSKNGGVTFQTSPLFPKIGPGVYDIVVTDAEGFCSATQQVSVVSNAPNVDDLTIQSTSVNHETADDANDGKITVTATGTNTPFSYEVYIVGTTVALKTQSSPQFLNLAPGAYNVKVIDSKGYSRTKTNIIVKEFEGGLPPMIEPRQVSEKIRIKYVPKSMQYENPFYVKFLNRLGGYTYWLFEKKQSYELEAEQIGEYITPYQNLAGLIGINFATFYQGTEIVRIGAHVPVSTAKGLSQIITSPEIYHITPDGTRRGKEVRLLPVSPSLRVYESDRLFSDFEVELSYPKLFL